MLSLFLSKLIHKLEGEQCEKITVDDRVQNASIGYYGSVSLFYNLFINEDYPRRPDQNDVERGRYCRNENR